jgi:hypothetical protein
MRCKANEVTQVATSGIVQGNWAGIAAELPSEVLLEATDTMMRARPACRAGRTDTALGLYGEIKLGRVRFGWLK